MAHFSQLHSHRANQNGTAKPVINIFPFINNTKQCSKGSAAPRNEISKATTIFSGSRNSKTLLWMLSRVSGSRKFKMATAKLVIYIQIHIRNAHNISQLLWHLETKFQRLPHVFGVLELKDTIANSARCNRKSVFKDGGLQTGSSYNSASRLDSNAVPTANPHFRGPATQRHYCQYCPMKPEVGF